MNVFCSKLEIWIFLFFSIGFEPFRMLISNLYFATVRQNFSNISIFAFFPKIRKISVIEIFRSSYSPDFFEKKFKIDRQKMVKNCYFLFDQNFVFIKIFEKFDFWRNLVFREFLYKISLLNDFLYDELHIILKLRNVKICDGSIFSISEQKYS